ncbi:hypothetical protein [Sphingomonas sp. PB4P5]|uniref:hypothetical protein n=1 Tax=Parasphingomonas puruogangriensis TaxID=3096155 RepID=UPI002FCA948D
MADTNEDPKVFVLGRELSEVHLLLDNLAANPTTNLSALTKDKPEWLPADWIEQVCSVNWPPAEQVRDQAKQAALLIKAKDYLNSLSYPASGATIAFTLLVTQEESADRERRRRASEQIEGDDEPRVAAAPSRRSMACAAYPDLAGRAARFRRMMLFMNGFLLIWLTITCAISWYVAFGNAQLGELATAQANLVAAQKRVDMAEAGKAPATLPLDQAAEQEGDARPSVAAAELTTPSVAQSPYITGYCDRIRLLPALPASSGKEIAQYESAEQRQACTGLVAAQEDVVRVQRSLARWLFQNNAVKKPGEVVNGPGIVGYAASLAGIIASAILPVLYGFLGAAAAVVRSLSRKTRASLLTPRDLQLSVQQLALGAVVGACIGLFIGQPSSDDAGTGLIGPVALSSSALSFVAGFGVEAVFETLEALIARIFNIATPAPQEKAMPGEAS